MTIETTTSTVRSLLDLAEASARDVARFTVATITGPSADQLDEMQAQLEDALLAPDSDADGDAALEALAGGMRTNLDRWARLRTAGIEDDCAELLILEALDPAVGLAVSLLAEEVDR